MSLEAENLALRHQLQILRRSTPHRARLRGWDRLVFVWLYRLWPGVLSSIVIVHPETVLRWHRSGFKAFWRSRGALGRPRLSREIRDLIREVRRDGTGSKQWTTQDGRVRGGGPFGRGALYHLLKNRVYFGLAVHKGEAWPGNHDAIVSQELWDRVQARLAENRQQADKQP